MYRLSPAIVRPGCTLRELIEHRKDTGLFSGDVDAYCKKILDGHAHGHRARNVYVQASDGRIVLAKNEPLPSGGWVSTHEDVTEQRRAEEERTAIRDQEQRRATIDGDDHLVPPAGGESSVERQRQRDRHALDRKRAVRLLRPDLAARRKRRAGLQRSLHQCGNRGGRRR